MVYYRKYRPQTIDQLDSEQVRETLTAVLSKDPPHAFLFTGPKGLGKTSAARIVAKAVNCKGKGKREKGKEKDKKKELHPSPFTLHPPIEPCNQCDQCTSITNGTNMDVIEIDAASNRGIDEIRELKDTIRLAPFAATKKMYIIDEVHMLTTEAFNALLKTLEEPPIYTLFVLCTTEPHKVPDTILSRCFHIAFHKATEDELVRSFRRIAIGENLKVDDETLTSIARLSDGGFRDGAKILEELATYTQDGKITKELLESKFQISNIQFHISNMMERLVNKDAKGALELVGKLIEQGVDMRYFVEELIEVLHEMLLVKIGIQKNSEFRVQSSELQIEDIKKLFTLLSRAHGEMRYAVLPQLPLELAVLEFVDKKDEGRRMKDEVNEEIKTAERISEKEMGPEARDLQGGRTVASPGTSRNLASLRRHVNDMQKAKILNGENEKKDEKVPVAVESVRITDFTTDGEFTKEWLSEFWKAIIVRMKEYNHTIAGVMRGCTLKSFDRKTVVIETGYKFHKDRLSEAKTLEALEKAASDLIGKKVKVEVVLKDKS